jgi:hypothetical protein
MDIHKPHGLGGASCSRVRDHRAGRLERVRAGAGVQLVNRHDIVPHS